MALYKTISFKIIHKVKILITIEKQIDKNSFKKYVPIAFHTIDTYHRIKHSNRPCLLGGVSLLIFFRGYAKLILKTSCKIFGIRESTRISNF